MTPGVGLRGNTSSVRPPATARWAAAATVAVSVALVATVVVALIHHPLRLLAALPCIAIGVPMAWSGATNRRVTKLLWIGAAVLSATAVALVATAGRSVAWPLAAAAEAILAGWAGGRAMKWEVDAAIELRWDPAPPSRRGVLIMNPRSGGGTVERCHLVEEAAKRGIEPVVLGPDDDLRQVAEAAADRGADVLGMAGGDGSQAVVAAVAADRGLGFVCVPAGTRNHLALDLGVNREDVVGALDAFGAARQGLMDLATVNDRVFVNNVSLGLYAEIVKSDAYRDAKVRTVSRKVPELLGPDAEGFDLSLHGPDGELIDDVQLVQISNGPYQMERLGAVGTRPQLDRRRLGVVALHLERPADVAAFLRDEAAGRVGRSPGWHAWEADQLRVDSGSKVAAGVDGEAVELDPPLVFAISERAVQVRIARHHPGLSPAATRHGIGRSTVLGLLRILIGRPSGLIVSRVPRPAS